MNKELKTNLDKSITETRKYDKCYLIKEDWFSKYKEFYLYSKISEYLSNTSIQREDITSQKDKIINEIYNKYKEELLKKLVNDKGEEVAPQNDNNNFNVEFKLSEDNKEMISPYKYSIINEKICNIITNNDNNIEGLENIISCKNIIIKYKENYLIIGVVDDDKDNLFIIRIIIKYNTKLEMKQDFICITENDYQSFEKNLNIRGEKIKEIQEKSGKKIVYLIDNAKYKKDINTDINSDLNYFHENIKLLFYLYGSYEELNSVIQQSNEQAEKKNYYIINKQYMNKIKEIFCYNKFYEELKEKNISNIFANHKKGNLISEMNFNEVFNNINEKFSNNFIGALNINIKEKFQKEIKDEKFMHVTRKNIPNSKDENNNNESLSYYYIDFEIISEEVKKYLLDNNLLSNQNEIIKIECLFKDNKIILYPNPSSSYTKDGNNILIAGNINKNNEFISEYVYSFKETSLLKNYLIHIEQKGYNHMISMLSFDKIKKSSNIVLYNSNIILDSFVYKIIDDDNINFNNKNQLIDPKINLMIKIYLYFNNLKNKVLSSQNNSQKEIFSDECYLINKKWMDQFKDNNLYNELDNIFINNIISLSKDEKGNIYNQNNIKIIYDHIANKEMFPKKISEKQINENPFEINEIEIGKNQDGIYCYNEFVIVNKEIFEDIRKNYNNNIILTSKKKDYIINEGKIIIIVDESDKKKYQLLVGELNYRNNEFNVIPKLLMNLKDGMELFNNIKKLKEINYNFFYDELKKNKYKGLNGGSLEIVNNNVNNIVNNNVNNIVNNNVNNIVNNNVNNNENEMIQKNEENINQFDIKKLCEKDIKLLIKCILFNERMAQFVEPVKNDENKILHSSLPKFGLVSQKWMRQFKEHYQFAKLKKLVEEENKCITPLNNNLINYDDNIINDIYNKIIDKYFSKEIFNNTEKLENQKTFEIEIGAVKENNYKIEYPKNFEIVEENIYNNLIKRKDIKLKNKFLSSEIIFSKQKAIMKINNSDTSAVQNFIILIGKLTFNADYNKFETEIILDFIDDSKRTNIFGLMKSNEHNEVIKNKNNKKDIKNIHYFNNNEPPVVVSSSPAKSNENNSHIDKNYVKDKIIKLLLVLYINSEELNEKIKQKISSDIREDYYLVNKDNIKEYKNNNDYDKIVDKLKKDKNIKKVYEKNKKIIINCMNENKDYDEYIFEIVKLFPEEMLNKLDSKKSEHNALRRSVYITLNSEEKMFDRINKTINYYNDNAIITDKFLNLFAEIEKINFLNLRYEKIKCLIGENKIFIINNENPLLINIGHLNDESVFETDLLMCFYEKGNYLNNFVSKIKSKNFADYLKNLNLEYNKVNYDIFNENEEIVGEIFIKNNNNKELMSLLPKEIIINENSKNLIKLYIYINNLIKEMKNPIKERKEKIKTDSGYLVKSDFILQFVDIKNYIEVRNLFINIEDVQDEQSFQNFISKFDKGLIKNTNKIAEKKVKASGYIKNLDKIQINEKKYLFYANKFFILNEQIFNLFKKKEWLKFSWNDKYEYFCGDNRIFIINGKNLDDTIEICKFNEHQELEVDLILNFDNGSYRNEAISSIKENGYEKYLEFLLFDGDYSSPIFDSNLKKIGYAYKIKDSNLNVDYTNSHINFQISKIILLYINDIHQAQNFSDFNNKNEFKDYFLINKKWIDKYKTYYEYKELSDELQNNTQIQNVLSSMKNNDNSENYILSDKKLSLIFKSLPENIKNNFNKNDKEFEKFKEKDDFKNEEKSSPFGAFNYNYNNTQKDLLFYDGFEIINSQLYDMLFAKMEMKGGFLNIGKKKSSYLNNNEPLVATKCMFYNNKIIINLHDLNPDDKFRVEIGEFDNNKIFKPECFLIYNNENSFKKHLNFIDNNFGFKAYCENIKKMQNDILEINDGPEIVGLSIKYNNSNMNNFINNQNKQPNNNNNIYNNYNNNNFHRNNAGANIVSSNNQKSNNNNSINQKIEETIMNKFVYPPKVGLVNIGSTCYMNATLQCFCQIMEFVSYFKYDNYVNNIINKFKKNKENCLTESFKKLIEAVWPEEGRNKELSKKYYEPYDFKNKISAMDPLFKSYSAKDAKDLVNFIVMTLHTELNKEDDNKNYNLNNFANVSQRDQVGTFKLFYTDFQNSFRSFISDLFYAIQQTKTQCLKCQTMQYNFQTYFFLIFPLEEVKKYEINKIFNEMNGLNIMNNMMNNNMNMNMNYNMNYFMNTNMNNNFNFNMNNNMNYNNNNIMNSINNNNMNILMNSNQNYMQNMQKLQKLNNNIVNIFDCFNYNKKIDKFTGNNAMFCNYCGQVNESYYCTTLLTLPKVLIILLNRGKGIEFKIKLEFTEILDLDQFVEIKQSSDQQNTNKYKLIGVITHLGNSGEDGHFIAHCFSPIDKEWYTYNDAIVTKITDFKKIIDFGMPYLLFYHKIDDNYQYN